MATEQAQGDVDQTGKPLRMAMTLDIQPGKFQEYFDYHQAVWPEIQHALHEVGVRNLSVWNWESRLFYYCEYVGERPFAEAMQIYSQMPRVQEWEELMHKYQQKLPGAANVAEDVWWQPCTLVNYQP
mmetsp:Transcript_18276/g.38173  ORF Transcript_18276/g.38173 Transcript_18276/m.38173 type:complete len:127 (-) Transcript_18276:166-546(-)